MSPLGGPSSVVCVRVAWRGVEWFGEADGLVGGKSGESKTTNRGS